jgi:hypothetical protein
MHMIIDINHRHFANFSCHHIETESRAKFIATDYQFHIIPTYAEI